MQRQRKTKRRAQRPVADKGWYSAAFAAAGLSQNRAAELMGLSSGALAKTFAGQRQLTVPDACKLSALLGQPIDVIVARAGFAIDYRVTLAPAR